MARFSEMTPSEKRALIESIRRALELLPSAMIREGASEEKLAQVRDLIEKGEDVIAALEAKVMAETGRLN